MLSSFHSARTAFSRLFHKRSIIIISNHKTNHISISGTLQVAGFLAVIVCVSLTSYSTGNYMAARSVVKQQQKELNSVANARIHTNFDYSMAKLDPQSAAVGPAVADYALPLTDPSFTLPGMTHDKLVARIAILEDKVNELRAANAGIIQTVREKTHDQITGMESLIRKTGLNPETLKKEAERQRKDHAADSEAATLPAQTGGQGGPFIPDDISEPAAFDGELNYRLDQVALLSQIISSLPLRQPLENVAMNSNFGRRIDPFTGRLGFHPGVDLSGPPGAKIEATGAGRVIRAGWAGAYGNCVDIDHGFGVVTRYGHMSALKVSVGDMVQPGQVIGIQGSTGRSTGPHVHYEVRYNNTPLNPLNFLSVGSHVSQNDAND